MKIDDSDLEEVYRVAANIRKEAVDGDSNSAENRLHNARCYANRIIDICHRVASQNGKTFS